jgi:hypothetical protein
MKIPLSSFSPFSVSGPANCPRFPFRSFSGLVVEPAARDSGVMTKSDRMPTFIGEAI